MSTIVNQIREAMETEMAAELGASWEEMSHKRFLEKNHFRDNDNKYGVISLGAEPSDTNVLCEYTMDQTFQVVLSRSYVDRDKETDLEDKIEDMFDKLSELIKRFFKQKLGIPSIVLFVDRPTIAEPEIFDDNKMVAIRADFNVKYRERFDA